jgi:hypothetical protein
MNWGKIIVLKFKNRLNLYLCQRIILYLLKYLSLFLLYLLYRFGDLNSLPDLIIVILFLDNFDIIFFFDVAIIFALINGGGICFYILFNFSTRLFAFGTRLEYVNT